jgi:hypothetical protein
LQIDVQGDPVSHKPGRPIIYTKSTNPANKKNQQRSKHSAAHPSSLQQEQRGGVVFTYQPPCTPLFCCIFSLAAARAACSCSNLNAALASNCLHS